MPASRNTATRNIWGFPLQRTVMTFGALIFQSFTIQVSILTPYADWQGMKTSNDDEILQRLQGTGTTGKNT